VVDPLPVRLPVSEITPPVALPKEYLSWSVLLILLVVPFVLDPISLEYLHILLIDLLLSLSNLKLLVLHPVTVE
jgi:hypothetical protein